MATVLVVDDQPVFRRAAVALVQAVTSFEVVGEAETGEQAVTMAARPHRHAERHCRAGDS